MQSLNGIERDTAASWFAEELVQAATDETPRPTQAAVVERSAPAGAMPPLHRRGEAETYRVLEGTVTFFVGDDVVPAGAGDIVVAPAHARRTFRVESEHARWMVVTRVTSLERFADFGRAMASAACGWPSADERAAVASIGAANGIELLGPPGALPDGRLLAVC